MGLAGHFVGFRKGTAYHDSTCFLSNQSPIQMYVVVCFARFLFYGIDVDYVGLRWFKKFNIKKGQKRRCSKHTMLGLIFIFSLRNLRQPFDTFCGKDVEKILKAQEKLHQNSWPKKICRSCGETR